MTSEQSGSVDGLERPQAAATTPTPANINVSVSNTNMGQGPAGRNGPGNGLAVAGFVCSLVSLVMFWVPGFNFIVWILGIVFSGIGLSRSNKQGAPHRGLAIAGLTIALIPGTLLVFVIFLVVIAAA